MKIANDKLKVSHNEATEDARRSSYRNLVDPLTLEYLSREIINDLSNDDKTEIVQKIAELRIQIKKKLPYVD